VHLKNRAEAYAANGPGVQTLAAAGCLLQPGCLQRGLETREAEARNQADPCSSVGSALSGSCSVALSYFWRKEYSRGRQRCRRWPQLLDDTASAPRGDLHIAGTLPIFLSRMLASGRQSADAKTGAQHKGRPPHPPRRGSVVNEAPFVPASRGKAERLHVLQLQEAATSRSMLPCQSKLSDRPTGEGHHKGASVMDIGTARYA